MEQMQSVQSFDIEDGKTNDKAAALDPNAARQAESSFFPIEPFKFLPYAIKSWLPGTWTRVQDATHLSLIIGVSSSGCLVILAATGIVNTLRSLPALSFNWIPYVIVLIGICPVASYFITVIGQYDEKLHNKHQAVNEQKEKLTANYNDLLIDMDGMLGRAAESSAGLAERSFESKRRDFQRFLERVKNKFGAMYSGTKSDEVALVAEFRRFVLNWLHVFQECSIDPQNRPKLVVTEEELMSRHSIAEICELTLERLKVTEVRFISVQRDQDAAQLKTNKKEIRRMTMGAIADTMGSSFQSQVGTSSQDMNSQGSSRPNMVQPTNPDAFWLEGGGGHGFGLTSGGAEGYPWALRCSCCRAVILSREHRNLLVGWLVGLGLIVWSAWAQQFAFLVLCALTVFCNTVLLCAFQDIDLIQQLEREVKGLEMANTAVKEQQEQMNEFWGNVQQLTDVWLHRTVPRLDLVKEIHSHLEDAQSGDLIKGMCVANQRLEDLEHVLGPITDWNVGGSIPEEGKKEFGKMIEFVSQEPEFDKLLLQLDKATGQCKLTLADQVDGTRRALDGGDSPRSEHSAHSALSNSALMLPAFGAPTSSFLG